MVTQSFIARGALLGASVYSAGLQLWGAGSYAARAAGDSSVMHAINVALLALAALGVIDLLWHDLRGRLLLPSVSAHLRHRVCVALYSALGLGFGIRAFLAAGGDLPIVLSTGVYYLLFGALGLAEAHALLHTDYSQYDRHDQRRHDRAKGAA